MAKVSISEAARLAGVSRQHLYRRYITPGLISIEKDEESAPMIDTAELLRVFGDLKMPGQGITEPAAAAAELEMLRRRLAEMETQLSEAREREAQLWRHIGEITGTLRLLEHKGQPGRADQLQKARRIIHQYKQALETERSKSFWARLFNQ